MEKYPQIFAQPYHCNVLCTEQNKRYIYCCFMRKSYMCVYLMRMTKHIIIAMFYAHAIIRRAPCHVLFANTNKHLIIVVFYAGNKRAPYHC